MKYFRSMFGDRKGSKYTTRIGAAFICLTCLFIYPLWPAYADSNKAMDYEVKAAYLYNFTKFVRWPEEAFEGENSPFLIGILGDQRISDVLTVLISGESYNNHPLKIKVLKPEDDLGQCQVIFISHNIIKQFDESRRKIAKKPTLTVSDDTDFLKNGGMIQFCPFKQQIKIKISQDAIQRVGFVVHSNLLKMAQRSDQDFQAKDD